MISLPKNPEKMRGYSSETLASFCYDYAVGTSEYEHYYRMEQPTHANKCYGVAKDELKKRKVKTDGVGGIERVA